MRDNTKTLLLNAREAAAALAISPRKLWGMTRGVKKLERAICYCILSSCRRVSQVISAAGSLLRYPPARTGFQRLGRLRN